MFISKERSTAKCSRSAKPRSSVSGGHSATGAPITRRIVLPCQMSYENLSNSQEVRIPCTKKHLSRKSADCSEPSCRTAPYSKKVSSLLGDHRSARSQNAKKKQM